MFGVIISVNFINNKILMFVWGCSKNAEVQSKRDSYCPLLFEKILRNYQLKTSVKSNRQTENLKMAQTKQQMKHSQPQKLIIDLNKKVKLVRSRFLNEENKENVQDNGATHYQHSNQLHKKHSDILDSFGESREQRQDKFLDIEEFIIEQKPKLVFFQQKSEFHKHEQAHLAYPQQSNSLDPPDVHESCCQIIQENVELPDIVMPFKQLSKCQFMNEQKYPVSQQQVVDNSRINIEKATNCQQDQIKESVQEFRKEESKQYPHQIKTKISIRILRKKLQTQSLQEVVQDLVKHRRIEFEDLYSKPEKQEICQALLSLMKNEIIQ